MNTPQIAAGSRVARAENIARQGVIVEFIRTATFGQEVRVCWDAVTWFDGTSAPQRIECLPVGEVWPIPA